MGIKWNELNAYQQSLAENPPYEPVPVQQEILRSMSQLQKRPRLERDEQRIFASWLQLHALPHCWHATHKRSTAVCGVFDFWVGKDGRSAWIEFKSPAGALSEDQQNFRARLAAHEIEWHVVRTAAEAISILNQWKA